MMSRTEVLQIAKALRADMQQWVLQDFEPHFGEMGDAFEADARWKAVRQAGTELWLDTGDLESARKLWTREFSALTTNNTLLNKEVQRGQYDELVKKTVARIRELQPDIPQQVLVLEVAFVLNAVHGLRLVQEFDAYVSVEEHTDLAHDVDLAVLYGERFQEICPERFIVKLPLTPAGLLGMRKLRQKEVPINFTLGFSARQNYVAARLGDPSFVNVFLGRLNSFVADSKLGSGDGVGERATAASQEAITQLRDKGSAATRQIAASMRNGGQVWTLAGTDVMTMPLKVAEEYHDASEAPVSQRGPRSTDIELGLDAKAAERLNIGCLWEVPETLEAAVDTIIASDPDMMSPDDLVASFRSSGVVDFFPEYDDQDLHAFQQDGKIPNLERWQGRLQEGIVSLDSLMNMSGLYSFMADQKDLDDRIRGLL
jgi:transaldolase